MFHGLKVLNCAGFPSSGCLDREVDQPTHADDVDDGFGECSFGCCRYLADCLVDRSCDGVSFQFSVMRRGYSCFVICFDEFPVGDIAFEPRVAVVDMPDEWKIAGPA